MALEGNTRVGQLVLDMLDDVESDFGDEDMAVGMVMVIMEFATKDAVWIVTRSTDPRDWMKKGFLIAAIDAISMAGAQ